MQDSNINNPEIQKYIQKKTDLQQKLLDYLTKLENAEESYQNLIQILEDDNIRQNKNDLIEFLHLLTNISNNHNKLPTFSSRIEKLLSIFKKDIMQYFSSKTIFNIFKDNKMLLLYLFEEKILTCDKDISNIFQSNKYKEANYPSFFIPKLRNF